MPRSSSKATAAGKSRSKPTAAKSGRARKKGTPTDWSGFWRASARFVAVVFLAGVAVGLGLGVNKIRDRAAQVLAVTPVAAEAGVVEVTFDWPPLPGSESGTWLPRPDQDELIRAAAWAAADAEPLSSVPLRRVSRTLAATGWFTTQPVVTALGPRRLHVSAEWRRPAAVVRWGLGDATRDYLISDQALRMPPEWRAGGSNRPVILGCAQPPPTDSSMGSRYDTPWPGQDIRAGLALLRVLASAGLLGEVAGVDVARHREGGPLELLARSGGRVVWGSGPDEQAEGEPSVAERVSRLRGLLDRTGRIDGGVPRIEIHREYVEIDRSARP